MFLEGGGAFENSIVWQGICTPFSYNSFSDHGFFLMATMFYLSLSVKLIISQIVLLLVMDLGL